MMVGATTPILGEAAQATDAYDDDFARAFWPCFEADEVHWYHVAFRRYWYEWRSSLTLPSSISVCAR